MKNFSSLSLNEWNVIIDKIKEMFFIDEDVYAFQKYLLSWFIKKKNTKENRQWFVWLFLLIKFFCRKIYLRMSMRNMTNANTRVSRKIIWKKWTQSFFFTYKKRLLVISAIMWLFYKLPRHTFRVKKIQSCTFKSLLLYY